MLCCPRFDAPIILCVLFLANINTCRRKSVQALGHSLDLRKLISRNFTDKAVGLIFRCQEPALLAGFFLKDASDDRTDVVRPDVSETETGTLALPSLLIDCLIEDWFRGSVRGLEEVPVVTS